MLTITSVFFCRVKQNLGTSQPSMKISLTFHALLGAAFIMPRAAAHTDLDSFGSFDALSIDPLKPPLAEDGDGFSLTTNYSPITTTTSRIIQVYVNNNGPDIISAGGAQNSCPSVNVAAEKLGDDIDQPAIVAAAGGAFTQAAGLDIANTIDLGASAAGTIKLPFTFTNAISTDPTTKLYLETGAGTGARIQFCVREKLQLLSGQVVDVMEVPLDFTVDFEGAFELTGGFASRPPRRLSLSGDWVQLGNDIDGELENEQFGTSVSMSGNGLTMAVGAPYNAGVDGLKVESGQVRVYKRDGSGWTQKGSNIDGEFADDEFGSYVSLSDDGLTVAIGARNNDGANRVDSGRVGVFEWDSSAGWMQKGDDIDGEAVNDLSRYLVSLSGDGLTVAIGAVGNDGNGLDRGHVRVLEWDSSAGWTQKGDDIDGEAAGDFFGRSVSLSADGLTVAVGAFVYDGNELDRRHVRVLEWDSSAGWTQKRDDIDGEAAGDYLFRRLGFVVGRWAHRCYWRIFE
jgi:hypothetical protein